MLQRLCSSGWSDLSMSQLIKLRHQNGLLLHTSAGQEEAAIEKTRKIVKEQLESGVSSRYGLVYATSSAKLTSDTFLPRVAVKRALEEIDPTGIDYRAQEQHRRRGNYHVAGPNALWAADGYDKLAPWSIQIYGIIDAYSRFIIHLFVSLSNRTLIAVQKYYLMAVKQYGFPHQTRTDKGTETLLMAECQMRF